MDLQLTDRVFIVTGGARGLGRATADALVAEGARVVISGRSQESLDEAVAALNDSAGRDAAVGVVADNADRETPARLLAAAEDAWGRVDGALISVGGPPKGPVADDHRRAVERGLRVGLPRSRTPRARGRRRAAGGWLARARAVLERAGAAAGDGDLQRAAPRPGDGRQDPRRRARPPRRAGQRPAAGPHRHRPGRRARRVDRGRRGRAARGGGDASRWGATASRRSSARWRRSCCRPPRHS